MPLPIIPLIALGGGLIFTTAKFLSSQPSQSRQAYNPAQADRAEANRLSQIKNTTQRLTVPPGPAPSFSRPVFTTSPVPSPPASPTKSTTSNNSGNKSNTGNSSGTGTGATPNTGSGSGSSSGSSSTSSRSSTQPVKSAPIDTVIFQDEAFEAEFLVGALFEDIVGQELLTISRNDTVNGQNVSYQPIQNLGLLQQTYNPNNIIGLSETSFNIFSGFVIQINDRIPTLSSQNTTNNYYVDPESGGIVIELINMPSNEQVEFQVATSGTIEELGI
jgi:hypothetical protein